MRANESLPLTLQADAAFLVRLAELGISDSCDKVRWADCTALALS